MGRNTSSSGGLSAIIALATFVTAWVYCTIHYGFLFGFGLGWLPAGMLAAMAGRPPSRRPTGSRGRWLVSGPMTR